MSTTKKYWKSVEHLNDDSARVADASNEFPEHIPVEDFLGNSGLSDSSTSRRDFLKFLGFSVTAVTVAACETPVTRAIPYVVKPEEITPGVANWYASTYADGNDYASILVKTREGRPIHIQGNAMSSVTGTGVNARVNSSVLSLYDSTKLNGPRIDGTEASWSEIDGKLSSQLRSIAAEGGRIAILTNSIISPTTKKLIGEWGAALGGENAGVASDSENSEGMDEARPATGLVTHVTYDTISSAGIINANNSSFGKAVFPSYRFDKAKVIVSVGSDFLSNWGASIENMSQYGKTRKPNGDWMSKHYQFETTMSLTGSNADVRAAIKPSEQGAVVVALYNAIAAKTGASSIKGGAVPTENACDAKIAQAAEMLLKNKGESLVVSGSNNEATQTIVNGINNMLGNYNSTIDVVNPSFLKQGTDTEVKQLIAEMKTGSIDAVLCYGNNPAHSIPAAWGFNEAIAKVKTRVSFADRMNETAQLCQFVCPDTHYLEAWSDARPYEGKYSLSQPVIAKIYDTRQFQDSLMAWAGMDGDFHGYLKATWMQYLENDNAKWNQCVHDGLFEFPYTSDQSVEFVGDCAAAAGKVGGTAGEWELDLYTKTAIGDGGQLRNPWLQELPDPVTKITWDNYIAMNPADMSPDNSEDAIFDFNSNLQEARPASLATVAKDGISVTLPVVPSPGQRRGTIGIALGYGQKAMLEGTELIGANASVFVTEVNGTLNFNNTVTVTAAEGTKEMGAAQTHHTMMGRKIVNETSLEDYKSNGRDSWNPVAELPDSYGNVLPVSDINLWNDHDIKIGHRWGMAIDLNTCIGCGACATACHSENNVAVVGRDEVRRNRDMHWMRIDRYFSSDGFTAEERRKGIEKSPSEYGAMEVPSEYPEVVFQPVMCQHCNHAPCETVCPVAATTHSNEGLNMMAYNRCVGTRYCANNCPYKVRRFNWFNYYRDFKFEDVNPSQDDLAKMVLNPDVVVRSRGVMEKCSMCVQRIQDGKLTAKKAKKALVDGDVTTACSQACPTNAITFGDINDGKSLVAAESGDDRAYNLLAEVGTQPNVYYMTKIRNASLANNEA